MYLTFKIIFAGTLAFTCLCVFGAAAKAWRKDQTLRAGTDVAWSVIPLALLASLGFFVFGHG